MAEEGEERTATQKREGRRTLFFRNLPYSTSDEDLKSVFEKYGTIKSCFTVKDKGILVNYGANRARQSVLLCKKYMYYFCRCF